MAMSLKKSVSLVLIVLSVIAQTAAAQEVTYLSMSPDTEFCISVIFGDNGRGEYTLTVDDPDYPRGKWVDTHRTSFTSGPTNPVITPVCFTTKDRRVRDEAMLHFTLETPEGVMRYDYGVCVSRHEDIDVIESSEDPCSAASSHTDIFNIDLLESEIYSVPGERVTFTLLVSSEFDMVVLLDKDSGPQMNITSTTIDMPADQSVDIVMDSPQKPGDYVFTVVARAETCDYPSCQKKVSGILHVSQVQETGLEGFRLELSPSNKNVVGMQSAKFYITVHNFDAEQYFSVNLQLDASLESDFNPVEVRVGKDRSAQIDFTVLPKSDDPKLYMIRALVENENGVKKSAESFLTIEEPVSDANRLAENNPSLRSDAEDYADSYGSGASLDEWEHIQDLGSTDDGDGGAVPDAQPGAMNWILIIAAVVIIASFALYIYRKMVVVQESDQAYF